SDCYPAARCWTSHAACRPRYLSYCLAPSHTELYALSYTTLFRSLSAVRQADAPRQRLVRRAPAPERAPGDRGGHPDRPVVGVRRDRKSTRLNSSHVKTSYAVFCSKKKKSCGRAAARASYSAKHGL